MTDSRASILSCTLFNSSTLLRDCTEDSLEHMKLHTHYCCTCCPLSSASSPCTDSDASSALCGCLVGPCHHDHPLSLFYMRYKARITHLYEIQGQNLSFSYHKDGNKSMRSWLSNLHRKRSVRLFLQVAVCVYRGRPQCNADSDHRFLAHSVLCTS